MKGSNKLNPDFQKQHWENSYGPIPDDWDFVTIGSLFQERREQSADKDTYPLYSFTIEDGVTPKTDRYERGFLLKDPENNQFLVVHPGDFVFNPMNLRFGAISYSKASFPVLVSAYYNILKPKLNKCDPDFMEAFLRSHEVMNLYDRIAIGSLIEKRRVHLSILNRTFIAIPPLKEQTVIGEKLKTWDRAIVQTSKLIEAKHKIKKGLMQ
jgi:type I restriction enzyme S subunit